MFRRMRILFVVTILLSISSFTQANPGGVGDGGVPGDAGRRRGAVLDQAEEVRVRGVVQNPAQVRSVDADQQHVRRRIGEQ